MPGSPTSTTLTGAIVLDNRNNGVFLCCAVMSSEATLLQTYRARCAALAHPMALCVEAAIRQADKTRC